MHYYKFNIADWALHTAHLTLVEEAVYFRLINHYYDTEQPISLETQPVIRRLRMGTESDIAESILIEFFVKTEKGFIHNRCEALLKDYRKTTKKNRANGAKGGRPKKVEGSSETQDKPSGLDVGTHKEPKHNPNQELLTTNHKPLTTINNNPSSDLVNQVFGHWQTRLNHSRSKLDKSRSTKINNALKLGYSIDELKQAIDGCAKSPYHMGQNEDSKVYDSIDLIFRNADKIDGFIKTNQMPIGGLNNEANQRPGTTRPDTSAAGRVRQNVAAGIAADQAQIDEIDRNQKAMATDVIDVRTQMDDSVW